MKRFKMKFGKRAASLVGLVLILTGFGIGKKMFADDIPELESSLEDISTRSLDEQGPENDAAPQTATQEIPSEKVETKVENTAPPQMTLEMAESTPNIPDTQTTNHRNEVTNLEFKMEGGSSRILISSRSKLNYRESRNQGMKQVIYIFENTSTQQRLERAYDTTEFISPVSLFTLLQIPKSSPPMTKLIVQLREDKFPVITNSDRGMILDFPAPDLKQEPKLLTSEESKGTYEENIYSGNQNFTGKIIKRLEIKNSDVQDVIRLIAKSSGYNVVVGDDVQGKVGTLSVENIPWDQAFTLVLQSKKLGYVRQGNVLRVATLSALKAEKEEALATEQSKMRVENLKTVIIPISYAKATDMASRATKFLSDRGSAEADSRSNTVIVKDIEKNVVRIQKLFSVLDFQPPKVSVAAKFVEMTQKFNRQIGLTHNFNGNLGGVSFDQITGSDLITGGTNGTNFQTVIKASAFPSLETKLRIGESEENVKVLASPNLAISSNQKGSVQAGTNYTFQTVTINNGVAQAGITSVSANLTLDVTPIVAGDGSISMDVSISNDVAQPIKDNTLPIDTRKVQTQVIVENGDTIVIGGVFRDSVIKSKSGVPLLMDIPILGYLFSGNTKQVERSEILVFLTPKILNVDEAFKRTM